MAQLLTQVVSKYIEEMSYCAQVTMPYSAMKIT